MPAERDHPVFEEPEDRDGKIWRYIDFAKYASMITTGTLFFARADLLGDPYEGAWSRANIDAREAAARKHDYPEHIERYRDMALWARQRMLVNCWHRNECESAAMWRLYTRTTDAVAIQSTFARLQECLPENALVGLVRYIDYDNDLMPADNAFYPFMYKRRSFAHEHEVRAVIPDFRTEVGPTGTVEISKPHSTGLSVHIDLAALVQRVHVAPTASNWFTELVAQVTQKYGLSFDVVRSELDRDPVF